MTGGQGIWRQGTDWFVSMDFPASAAESLTVIGKFYNKRMFFQKNQVGYTYNMNRDLHVPMRTMALDIIFLVDFTCYKDSYSFHKYGHIFAVNSKADDWMKFSWQSRTYIICQSCDAFHRIKMLDFGY